MRAKILVSAALLYTALAAPSARAQYPAGSMNPLDMLPPPGAAQPAPGGPAPPEAPAQLSRWITGDRSCDCLGPVGGDGPIYSELYARTGPSLPIGGGILYDTLRNGWAVEGGARVLLFDTDMLKAWTIQVGVLHIWNHGKNPGLKVPFDTLVPDPNDPTAQPPLVRFGVDVPGLTIRSLNRTLFNLGLGREWYMLGAADCAGPAWRLGLDAGGRYGLANLETHELRHRTDVVGGLWVALHSDLEVPWGCCTLFAGFRAEWGYTWSDVLRNQNNSDLQDVNLMLNLGVRF